MGHRELAIRHRADSRLAGELSPLLIDERCDRYVEVPGIPQMRGRCFDLSQRAVEVYVCFGKHHRLDLSLPLVVDRLVIRLREPLEQRRWRTLALHQIDILRPANAVAAFGDKDNRAT